MSNADRRRLALGHGVGHSGWDHRGPGALTCRTGCSCDQPGGRRRHLLGAGGPWAPGCYAVPAPGGVARGGFLPGFLNTGTGWCSVLHTRRDISSCRPIELDARSVYGRSVHRAGSARSGSRSISSGTARSFPSRWRASISHMGRDRCCCATTEVLVRTATDALLGQPGHAVVTWPIRSLAGFARERVEEVECSRPLAVIVLDWTRFDHGASLITVLL
jgi:hypothetical protein